MCIVCGLVSVDVFWISSSYNLSFQTTLELMLSMYIVCVLLSVVFLYCIVWLAVLYVLCPLLPSTLMCLGYVPFGFGSLIFVMRCFYCLSLFLVLNNVELLSSH